MTGSEPDQLTGGTSLPYDTWITGICQRPGRQTPTHPA